MIVLILSLGVVGASAVSFGLGYFAGVGNVMRKLPPTIQAKLAAGQAWRPRR